MAKAIGDKTQFSFDTERGQVTRLADGTRETRRVEASGDA